ncbi:coatomer gamma 2-subunit [Cyclospora cayetanensis]|uniref:Coatomer gamma 2-subunit n=1 Tax=Cyclospora cayetanensis TaxID=88456 RepID=A0A1D3D1Z5_9EIME|nr:coatomer gamma 2-subunit [Cyclospora cayetanensis]
MAPCEGTEAIGSNNSSHELLLSGIFVGGQQVLAKAFCLFPGDGCLLRLAVRSLDLTICEAVCSVLDLDSTVGCVSRAEGDGACRAGTKYLETARRHSRHGLPRGFRGRRRVAERQEGEPPTSEELSAHPTAGEEDKRDCRFLHLATIPLRQHSPEAVSTPKLSARRRAGRGLFFCFLPPAPRLRSVFEACNALPRASLCLHATPSLRRRYSASPAARISEPESKPSLD